MGNVLLLEPQVETRVMAQDAANYSARIGTVTARSHPLATMAALRVRHGRRAIRVPVAAIKGTSKSCNKFLHGAVFRIISNPTANMTWGCHSRIEDLSFHES